MVFALETNAMFFYSNFELMSKNKNIQTNRGVNIDQSAMCCISMDSFRQALQFIGKLSSFRIIFFFYVQTILLYWKIWLAGIWNFL